jgi:hypothetical protein
MFATNTPASNASATSTFIRLENLITNANTGQNGIDNTNAMPENHKTMLIYPIDTKSLEVGPGCAEKSE